MSILAKALSDTTPADVERRLGLIERGHVRDRQWCLVDVAMRLGWLAARGAPASVLDPLTRRFRAAEAM